VIRSTSFAHPANELGTSAGGSFIPTGSYNHFGFRVVCEADPVPPPPAIAPFDEKKAKAHQRGWARHLGVPVETTNSIGMKLRLIPPGEFTMGTTPAEVDWLLKETEYKLAPPWVLEGARSEGPDRRVTIREPFYLGTYEVTVG